MFMNSAHTISGLRGNNLMKRLLFAIFLCFQLSGCTMFKSPVDAKTVALMTFSSPSSSKNVGQEAADRVALELVAKGYVVIDRSITSSLVNEAKFYSSGLSDDMRRALQAHNISAFVFGSVNEYNCEVVRPNSSSSNTFGSQGSSEKKNLCTVSITAKIADTSIGRLLWGVTINETSEGVNLTALEVMKSLIRKADLSGSLPESIYGDVKVND